MRNVVSSAPRPVDDFGEKEFYLDEFRAHTLCFAIGLADCERPGGFETLGRVVRELLENDTRVIVLFGMSPRHGEPAACLRRVKRRLQRYLISEETVRRFPRVRGRRSVAESFVDLTGAPERGLSHSLEFVWATLRGRPLLVGVVEDESLVEVAQRLAGRLRVHKLVFVVPLGGIASASAGSLSFMDATVLTAVLQEGEAEWAGLAPRRGTLEAIRAALYGGVYSVNLCMLEGLARELYTYEGSGTLFTLADYCRVERLGIDDFEEVERLVARGLQEGYLKLRSPEETTKLVLNGFGATIGAHHLAGICALETEPYADERAGEITGVYTITRFKGEGVGSKLIDRVVAEASDRGLRYVFACTTEPRAQTFFERQGFRRVTPDAVPDAKWVGYDPARLRVLKIYRRDIEEKNRLASGRERAR
jgi:N-acetylglutamate synthase-like GNAT family acetyltransferase